jgi:ribosomal protein L11 methyltransferase
MTWLEIKLETPQTMKDPIVNRLFELGAQGVNETDIADKAWVRVSAYFEDKAGKAAAEELPAYLASLKEIFPEEPVVKWESVAVPMENWSETYKDFYRAQKLTHLFFLRPAWDTKTPIPEEMLPIVMEPGQAFGTGLHPTTRLCMRRLERLISIYPRQANINLLDVGTGTGILAIAAYKLGIRKITATDIDPLAVTASKENFELNDCAGIQVSDQDLGAIGGEFHVIVSNILLDTHIQLRADYRRLLKPGGQLILSGVLVSQRRALCDALKEVELVNESWEALDEWACALFTHRNRI